MSYFSGDFLHTMALLGYLPELERGLGLDFSTYFLHDLNIKMLLN